jgi:hypothetical protein
MARRKLAAKPGEDAENAKKAALACDLRCDGMTYAEIATAMHVSASTAQRLVERGCYAIMEEPGRRALAVELRRLERMHRGLVAAGAFEGDGRTVIAAMKVGERRAKLLGLDQAAKVELTGKGFGDMTDAEVLALAKGGTT